MYQQQMAVFAVTTLLIVALNTVADAQPLTEAEAQAYAEYKLELDRQHRELAKHLRNCSPLEQPFTHPFTDEQLTRFVKGSTNETCHYTEEMPNNGLLECFYPIDKLEQIAYYYENIDDYENGRSKSTTTFVDGKAVTKTEYIIDGKAVFHPLLDSHEKGECKILGYGNKE